MTSENDLDVIHVVRFFYPQTPLDKSKYSFDDYLSHKGGKSIKNIQDAKGLSGESIGNTTLRSATEKGVKRVAVNLNYSFIGEYNK